MNLANKLTLLRIFLVPVFMFVLLIKIPYGEYIAAAIFIIAASTDGLDGYIARKRKQITNLGKLMDPLADKLLITAALISLVELGIISGWIAFIIIGREFFVTGIRTIAAAEGVIIAASKLGKIKTISQIIAIVVLLLNDFPFSLWQIPFGKYALYIAVFFTIWSGVDYFLKARKSLKLK
ncbi:MAG TPA: CDP-diacylglycerol--glycerol-3-phosphate 3-phosphatidyltransferase [Peptococcaceae bacterium]|jgi:CDP-diacylglycerol--glycerol-3-phosphate 3-phosphatidyltransferase|nr:CDP-diacylglycerol--glycerol-3-phosphate 3-phosphatidyltransferase [Clostridia bacterium]HOB81883.1 CDP-diacylglycerol--glycerol-3-phosphate 3-phosphatidyltransferase [Peptococcaceae bacterium]HQD53851.1 CDP-diacylglycerol--glycerol-3-phosphate 3-phosphatidyltransferase [Peptococcaceae bacterium]